MRKKQEFLGWLFFQLSCLRDRTPQPITWLIDFVRYEILWNKITK